MSIIQLKSLCHNGVLIPNPYVSQNLTIRQSNRLIKLTSEEEEMIVAWVKKIGTPYTEDKVFKKNFFKDFLKKINTKISQEIDLSQVIEYIEEVRQKKKTLSKIEKKQLANNRKILRETNREHYGYALVNNVKMEISNYTVEPNGIFIGRGNHPLRGRWKIGPKEDDILLNLSPDSPIPNGQWKAVIWQPDKLWIAKWKDKLTGKIKYVWLSDSSTLKQEKEREKFQKAEKLSDHAKAIRKHIMKNLDSENIKRRKTATVCYLIDKLKIRVGDEKDPDEADTVGASTLRPEHLQYNNDCKVSFDFLGKDSVPHKFKVKLPKNVIENLQAFSANTRTTLFKGVRSKDVSDFLDEVVKGLSSKVFRTYYATTAVAKKLKNTKVTPKDPDYLKKHIATLANLEAAKICNHKRTIPKNWKTTLEKKKARLINLEHRATITIQKNKQKIQDTKEKHEERTCKENRKLKAIVETIDQIQKEITKKKRENKSTISLKNRIVKKRKIQRKQKNRMKESKMKNTEKIEKLEQYLVKRIKRDKELIAKLRLNINLRQQTRDYNLSTSLKSYINPRIYYKWGKTVKYDWKNFYSKTLQKKFSWVEDNL